MKKSLTFIFAAALLVSCQQEENETKLRLLQTVALLSLLLLHVLRKLTLRPEIKSVLQSPKTVTSYMQRINR